MKFDCVLRQLGKFISPKAVLCFWAWIALTALLFSMAAELADAKPRRTRRKGEFEFRLRAALMYGYINYASDGYPGTNDTSLTGIQPALRLDYDTWFNSWFGTLSSLDFHRIDYKGKPDFFRGNPIYFIQSHTSLGLRFVGKGNGMGTEMILYGGINMNYFPDVKSYPNLTFYDVSPVKVIGLRAGLRNRFKLTEQDTFEVDGFWVFGQRDLNTDLTFERHDSRNVGITLTLDHHVYNGFGISAGYHGGYNRIHFKRYQSIHTRRLNFNVNYGMVSLYFWF